MRPLEITSLTKSFGPYCAVKDFSLTIRKGEFVCLLGHSGCGKSTVLSVIAGLQKATFGGVCINGKETDEPGIDRGVVFQSPCLLPWLTVIENVILAQSKRHPNYAPAMRKSEAMRYLTMVGVEDAADQLPSELSQGTQQRVSIARALSLEPEILLFDEPFGMLDSLTRFDLQDMLLDLWEKDRKTVVMVTHDIDEALYLADRIILMTDGPEAGIGEDLEIPFTRPRTRETVLNQPAYLKMHAKIIDFLENHSKQFAA